MPVLKFTNDEIGTLLHALRTEAGEWLRYKTFHGSAENINSVSRILENVNALEERVQEIYCNMTDEDDDERLPVTEITEAEAKRRTAVANMIIAEIGAVERVASGYAPTEDTPAPRSGSCWHHEHGWLPSALHKLSELREFESAGPYGGFGRAEASSVEDVGDQMSPGTWTTLPDEFDANDTLFSCFNDSEYDRIEISVNGAWRNRYRVRKSESDKFLKDLAKVFIDRD